MTNTLLLKHFLDVTPPLKGRYTYRIDSQAPVPPDSLKTWQERGYDPATIGVAYVKFGGKENTYTYPAYFWAE